EVDDEVRHGPVRVPRQPVLVCDRELGFGVEAREVPVPAALGCVTPELVSRVAALAGGVLGGDGRVVHLAVVHEPVHVFEVGGGVGEREGGAAPVSAHALLLPEAGHHAQDVFEGGVFGFWVGPAVGGA